MKITAFVTRALLALAISLSFLTSAQAQTFTLNSTTTSAAIAATDTSIAVTSASAASGASFGSIAVGQQIYIPEASSGLLDGRGELMTVTAVSGTTITVQRRDRARAHPSGALIYIGSGSAFYQADPPAGSCTVGNQGDPWINVANGAIWRCVSSLWVRAGGDDVASGLPKPAAATALVGAKVLNVTAGAGGATTTAATAGGAGGAPTVVGGTGGAGSTSGAGGAGGAVVSTGGGGGTAGTTGAGGAGGAISPTGGVGAAGGTTSGTGGAGGAVAPVGGVGGAGTAASATGGAGGAFAAAAGAGGASGSSGTGGAGGAASVAGGAGGGTITGGAGGNASLLGGAGGNGSTAGGSGGNAIIQAGAAGTGGTGTAGIVQFKDATDATKIAQLDLSALATATTRAIPYVLSCGATGTGNQTCSPSAATAKTVIASGQSTLSSNTATITFAPGWTSTSTYFCVANDVTTRANPVQMVPASATTATITNTTGGSDVIQWVCIGN